MEPKYILQVKNVYKKYSTDYILQGLFLSLPKGSMYGLLGPSGCGKTTLLRCILGQLDIDSGIIRLSVDSHKNIGFMPQATSLHGSLTVRECLMFYGLMAGITGQTFQDRLEELRTLLDLPPLSTLSDTCSGGQQRRVSLAITLLHNPELLILDEPTVGLDPLLAQRIWQYLKDLSIIQKKTILVTTHYMEEARGLNLIGLMREGVLLVEKPPMELIEEYNCSSLDDVFLEVIKEKETTLTGTEIRKIDKRKEQVKSTPILRKSKEFDFNHVKAQIYKNYKWTLRSLLVSSFVMFLPLLNQLLAGWQFNRIELTKGLLYYDEELISVNCSDMRAVQLDSCLPSNLYSCTFLDLLSTHFFLKRIDSLEEGFEIMRKGDSYALVYIPYNFTTSLINRMSFRLREIEATIDDEIPLKLWLDNTYYHLSYKVQYDAYMSLRKLLENKCEDCGIDIRLPTTTISFRPTYVYGGEDTSFMSLVYPILTTGSAFYASYTYITATVLMDINSGVLERAHVNGMTTAEMMTADSIIHLIMAIIQNIMVLLGIHVIMDEILLGNIFLMFSLLVLCQINGSLIGLLVLMFDVNSSGTNYIGVALATSLALSGGMVWPIEGVHWLLWPIVRYSPFVMVSKCYGHVMQHGFGLLNPHVYLELMGFMAYLFLWLILIVIRVKYFHTRI